MSETENTEIHLDKSLKSSYHKRLKVRIQFILTVLKCDKK